MTMTNPDNSAPLVELQAVVDTFGGDRARWPAAARLRLATLVATDVAAARIVAEAVALDRLLDLAPSVTPDRERALADRLRAMAAATPQDHLAERSVMRQNECGSATATVTSLGASTHPVRMLAGVAKRPGRFGQPRAPLTGRTRQAAALLAASLMLGVFIGTSDIAGPVVSFVTESLGLSDDEQAYAFANDLMPSGDDT
jgi:hypothetical protein